RRGSDRRRGPWGSQSSLRGRGPQVDSRLIASVRSLGLVQLPDEFLEVDRLVPAGVERPATLVEPSPHLAAFLDERQQAAAELLLIRRRQSREFSERLFPDLDHAGKCNIPAAPRVARFQTDRRPGDVPPPRPASRARTIACARLRTPSLLKTIDA